MKLIQILIKRHRKITLSKQKHFVFSYVGLLPPYLSIGEVPGSATPSLEVVWKFPYPTYVDYVTIYLSKNNAVPTQLTWMRVSGIQHEGSFTFVAVDLGSKYSVAVGVQSGEVSVTSNYDTAILCKISILGDKSYTWCVITKAI